MNTNRLWAAPLAAGVSSLLLLLPASAALAQDAAPPPPPDAGAPAPGPSTDTAVLAPTPAGRPLRSVVGEMGRLAGGAIILADSTVSTSRVLPPDTPTTPDNLTDQLDALVRTLPTGAVWGKVYIPVPGSGSSLDADAVSQYIAGQARLFGTVGAAPTGKVEIMGQRLTPEQAAPVIAALNLKPVYLITNPRAAAASSASSANYSQMSPAERRAYAQQQAQSILGSSDPTAAQQYLQQQADVMRALMQQLPPDQRQQLMGMMRFPRGGGPYGGGQDAGGQ